MPGITKVLIDNVLLTLHSERLATASLFFHTFALSDSANNSGNVDNDFARKVLFIILWILLW